jgi:ferritin-like metal-binding protein YciE
MQITNLRDVLEHELQDLYSAETQIVEALPAMIDACTSEKLKSGFERHLEQTEEQVSRLEEVMEMMDLEPGEEVCVGMEGLIAEGQKLVEEQEMSPALDVALISAAQRIEHYEIAAYGSAITFAKELGEKKVVEILKETMDEEEDTDKKLSTLAETDINKKANTQE